MAGYSKLYCVGGLGGFMGADGVNPILFQILVGDADRQWLEAHYFDKSIKPLGEIKVIIPARPDDENSLLDACIAFYPQHFADCPSLPEVEKKVKDLTRLDFDLGMDKVPEEWHKFRKEGEPMFKQLNIFEAQLKRMEL